MKLVRLLLVAGMTGLFATPGAALAALKVVASTNDLASIAASVGGTAIEVSSIAKPGSDVHRVEVLPSSMVRVSKAALYLKVGLGLDQWADGIIDGSRNPKIKIIDCSQGVTILEKPSSVSAAQGDVHPFGNPHYWLDPRNGGIVAGTIADAFAAADPAHAADFRARAAAFDKECQATWQKSHDALAGLRVRQILTYHRSFPYFANAFDLEVLGTVEPVPGIPPTGKHLAELVEIVKARKVGLLLQEPYFSDDAGKFLTRETGIRVAKAAPSCDGPIAGSYLAHFADITRTLTGGNTP
jgi:zinc/manganese transport system substrate-binding protein